MIRAADVLEQLRLASGLDSVDPAEELFDLGIDSVRLMRLTEGWRAERPSLDFAAVAGAGTVAELLDVLGAER
ncbi:phosphopantetheine-binding protein [Mycetocola reblochoni]|uniref:Carrier domain-containing protein n=2 Tax=Mycetocola reblochoni TaxID=331618 RepID=A0A1R4IC74_9MICO|nr:phosphopantetheine-binding protein [Mycetocola reblochoni]RLP69135.1 hypothetical protein D9V30_07405 [Mycetocola reblochoni]SJN17442.1 hypothetical protein FM119_00955 [Mycetocola reblochoni REB411]